MTLPRLAPANPNDHPESDWPAIRARLATEKIGERRKRAASPRLYMDGYVPGDRAENVTPPSQG